MSSIFTAEPEQLYSSSPTSHPSTMAPKPMQLRRSRPSQVQTNFQSPTSATSTIFPISAISSSSRASNSQQGSPIMSPETAILTTSSSVQASPEPAYYSRDIDICPPGFELPDPILSRKTSTNSLGTNMTGSPSAMFDAMSFGTSAPVSSGKGSIIRRLSSRASRSLNRRRRQSSVAPASRDGSVGPCFLRRRSDSNTTAPPDYASFISDSEDDIDDIDDLMSLKSLMAVDGVAWDSTSNSTAASAIGTGSNAMIGPVLPPHHQKGTWLRKVSQKRNTRPKRICLVYDMDTNKLTWDKTRPNKFLHVDEIKEIRCGTDIHQYSSEYKIAEYERPRWFSIFYSVPEKKKAKAMHLIADDIETYATWTTFLTSMLKHRQAAMTSLMAFDDQAIAQFWRSEMSRQFGDQIHAIEHGELDMVGVKRVCSNLHIYSSQFTLEENFRLSDARSCGKLNFNEFLEFVRLMNRRTEVQLIFRNVAARPEIGLSVKEFLTFVRDVQGENVDANKVQWEKIFLNLVRRHRTDDVEISTEQFLSEAGFVSFLASKHNAPIVEEPQKYTLDRPMNEYFISSSHNTYLLGRQVAGQSSVEGYIAALGRGCRCVEVDCWDGDDGYPKVVHGRTLTSDITFRDAITTINKYAFVASQFPLWISLEVHCSAAQQEIMANDIKEIFGSKLVTAPLDPTSDKLPSPSELLGRVLIKVKKPRMKSEPKRSESRGRRRGSSLSSPAVQPTIPEVDLTTRSPSIPQSPMLTPSPSARRLVPRRRVNTIAEGHEVLSSSTSDNDSGSEGSMIRRSDKKSDNKTVEVLGRLGVYCAGVKFQGFDTPDAKRFNHIFSFMESSFAKHSRNKEEKMAVDIHNMRYLMRVYPDGIRVGSSNFDPLMYWRRGVQMAALNWQTFDLGMQINQAMFQGGRDSSGYVLKPNELRDIQVLPYNSAIAEGKKERSVVSFSIDVISAQQLMRPANLSTTKSMDPYVSVEIFHANDKRDKIVQPPDAGDGDSPIKFSTEVVRENGFNPTFSNGQFKFKVTTKHPELIFVRWSVRLSNDREGYKPAIASYTAKLCNLKHGFRTLPLLNHVGDQYLFSTLFCKIQVDPIEKKLIDISRPVQESSKLNRLGGKVFARINSSPRGTMENFESHT